MFSIPSSWDFTHLPQCIFSFQTRILPKRKMSETASIIKKPRVLLIFHAAVLILSVSHTRHHTLFRSAEKGNLGEYPKKGLVICSDRCMACPNKSVVGHSHRPSQK